jgi:tetratricopeptide (TPR) repeat protein
LGFALLRADWDWAGAGREFRRALELNPNSAVARIGYAHLLVLTGRRQDAISQAERGHQVDPLSPSVIRRVSGTYCLAGEYDRGIQVIRKAQGEVDPRIGQFWLGACYEAKGIYEQAIVEFKKLGEEEFEAYGHLGHAYAASGRVAEAQKVLRRFKELTEKRGIGHYEVALIYAGLADKDRAFEWLEKAYEKRDQGMAYLKVDPGLKPLRSDPRFQDLLRRMNFPQ